MAVKRHRKEGPARKSIQVCAHWQGVENPILMGTLRLSIPARELSVMKSAFRVADESKKFHLWVGETGEKVEQARDSPQLIFNQQDNAPGKPVIIVLNGKNDRN